MGSLFGSVFLDTLREDARRLERVNALLAECPGPSDTGLRPVDLFVLRPSRDLAEMARDLVLFEPEYLKRLMELGEEDAWTRADELEEFLRGGRGTPSDAAGNLRS